MSEIFELKPTAWSAMKVPGIILLTMTVLCSSASAECSVCTFMDAWIMDTIDNILHPDLKKMVRSGGDMIMAPTDISDKDIILDGSDYPTSFIPGAVHISYREFLDSNNTALLKSVPEIAGILGDAGISQSDPLVVYGECAPCGGGPSTATYVYWLLRYIGHDDVRLLNGGLYAWQEAGLPLHNASANKARRAYSPDLNSELYATYEHVMSGEVQIVDARSEEEFESETIPGAINIPFDRVLDGKMIQDEGELEEIFENLTKDKPVVVFSTTGTKASASWFALTMLGYDARMYTFKDWRDTERDLRRQSQEINRSN